MLRAICVAFAAVLFFNFACEVRAESRPVGAWLVEVDKDPFSTKKKSIAITGSGNNGALAIRCFPDSGLSVVVILSGEKHFDAEAKVPFKYRADEGAIVEEVGEAFGEGSIEMPIANQIRHDAQTASALYLRISTPNESIVDLEFRTRGASKALAQINRDCPSDGGDSGGSEKPPAAPSK